MAEEKKKNPINIANTGLVIVVIATVLVGYWMVGQTVAVEGEGINQRLSSVMAEVTDLKIQIESLKRKIDISSPAPVAVNPAKEDKETIEMAEAQSEEVQKEKEGELSAEEPSKTTPVAAKSQP